MNEEEYRKYLMEKVNKYLTVIDINKLKNEKKKSIIELMRKVKYADNYTQFYFMVHDGYIRYFVEIIIYNDEIYHTNCECYDNHRYGTCNHIKKCLYYQIKEIFPRPLTDYEKALNILNIFKGNNTNNESKKNNVRELLKLEIEISLDNTYSFKLHIGLNKLYVINNDTKFRNFIKSYLKNEEYVFGKNFTYDSNKYYFSNEDKKLLDYFARSNDHQTNLSLSERELLFLLDILKDRTFRLTNYGLINNISSKLPDNIFYIDKNNDNYILKFNSLSNIYISNSNKFMAYNNTLYILGMEDISIIKAFNDYKLKEISFRKKDLDLFKNGLLLKIKNNIVVSDNIDEIVISKKPKIKLYFDFERDKLCCNIKLDYNGKEIDYFDNDSTVIRDEETEQTIINKLLNEFNFNIDKNKIVISNLDDIGYFIEYGLENLTKEYEVFTSKKIDNTLINKQNKVTSLFSIGYDGIMTYSFDTAGINHEELNKVFTSIKNKKKYYKLKNGNIINLQENNELNQLVGIVEDLNIDINNIDKDGNIIIPKYRAFYIDSLKDNRYNIINTDNSFMDFINRFKEYKNTSITFSKFDEKTLRDYQKDGVKWLYTLYKCDLGGILADEMGLGKSLQTISFIRQVLKEKPNSKILIVSPTALVYNWKKEFDKFAPEMKYIPVADNKQKRKEIINNFDNYNIFITSYGLIRNDNDEYEDKEFELCIIDEAQAIKNYQAGLTKEIKKIKAKTKIALTGTPIENSVYELWSIFDFIMPGYLSSITSFRENYGIHEVDNESLKKLDSLNYQIKPFILRRKKKDVIKDLPDKIENNIYLELPELQKTLYLKVLKDTKEEIDELIATEGWSKARFKLLTLLTRLRQICIDPSIVYDNYKGESIKMEKLIEIVHNFINDGHKILIFSTFKTVIESVKKSFDNEKISSYVIAGDVLGKKRTELVDKFNNDDTNCFLITLKSGGTGLNLVGADIVIHLDIWWNPQAENQATDRAHRIGQTKNVTVIKLITKGTIEERIIELQDKKKIISENLIEGKNDSKLVSSLTEEEMEALLSYGQDD